MPPFQHASLEAVSRALRGSPVTVFFQRLDGTFGWFENGQTIWDNGKLTGAHEREAFTAKSLESLERARQQCVDKGSPVDVEVQTLPRNPSDHEKNFLKITMQPARDDTDTLVGYLCSSVNITIERQREQTLRTLLREVAHRSKNMLAIVLSLSAQTARYTHSKKAFVRALAGRIQSLAKSQDVITDANWEGARLQAVVKTQVLSIAQWESDKIVMAGDDPQLTPNATLHVGLALHELLTNSLMYGVLSVQRGEIAITCETVADDTGERSLRLRWEEGPVAAYAPGLDNGGGFGCRLLERVVPTAVSGKGELKIENGQISYLLTVGQPDFS